MTHEKMGIMYIEAEWSNDLLATLPALANKPWSEFR